MIEILVLNVSLVLYLTFRLINLEFFIIYYLVFTLCERVLGLCLLILIVRYKGNDLYYSFNIMKY